MAKWSMLGASVDSLCPVSSETAMDHLLWSIDQFIDKMFFVDLWMFLDMTIAFFHNPVDERINNLGHLSETMYILNS